jgi:hypothetical protein|tara:strand:+ start:261 stop:542 length:282 start_codon:yes stop_codon:yes gene_type:complete
MSEDKNKPSSGSLFKSKFKTNDGSEEDNTRENYYGTYRDVNGKVWKLKGYINKSEYGSWLKIYTKEINADGDQRPTGDTGSDGGTTPEEDIPF